MKKSLTLLLLCWSLTGSTQQKVFHSADTRIKVYYGDTIAILTDSAYIVSAAQALLLNEKLLALREAQRINRELFYTNEELMERIYEIELQVTRLMERMQTDHRILSDNLQLILSDLDLSIALLEQANSSLSLNNDQLRTQLEQMDETVKHLRQVNRKMALRRIWDKVIFSLIAFGVGYLVGSV